MAESNEGYAKMAIKRSTHTRLKQLAEKNGVTLSSFVDDMVAQIDDDASSYAVRFDKIDDTLSLILMNFRDLENHVLDMDDELAASSDVLPKYSSGVRRREYERRKEAHEQGQLEQNPEYQAWIKAAREGKAHLPCFNTGSMMPVSSPIPIELGEVPSLDSMPNRSNFKADKKGVILPRPNPKNLKR